MLVEWTGEAPKECQICRKKISRTFIDGMVIPSGSWAILCETCHGLHGNSLGTGRGQEYTLRPDGNFHKSRG